MQYTIITQGRDGAGAAPCCGTGVLFRRDALVSIGGQAHESVTEDFATGERVPVNGVSSAPIKSIGAAGYVFMCLSGSRVRSRQHRR
jgi:cellulose synthase/poly-beta-1,6-N-acetylglucosamine synthase-like glycosyltransferase